MSQPIKATRAAVNDAFERLRQNGTPPERITQRAIREEIGGGSYSSIQQHLKPLRDAHSALNETAETDGQELYNTNNYPVPETVSRQITDFRDSFDQFAMTISRAVARSIDELASNEGKRHRDEVERLNREHEHQIAHLQGRYETVANELEELAAESRELEELRERVPHLEAQIASLTNERDRLNQDQEHTCQRARDAKQLSEQLRQTTQTLENKLDRARAAASEAEKLASEARAQMAAATERCQTTTSERDNAIAGWRQAEACCSELQAELQHAAQQNAELERRNSELADAKSAAEEGRIQTEAQLRAAEARAINAEARASAADRSMQQLEQRLDKLIQAPPSRTRKSKTSASSRGERETNGSDS